MSKSTETQTIDVDVVAWTLRDEDLTDEALKAALGEQSEAERDRARRLVNPDHGRIFSAHHARLRRHLATRLGCERNAIEFTVGAHGKPHISAPDGGLNFSLTHSARNGALAMAAGVELGVDLEIIRPIEQDLARRFFSTEEADALDALPISERERAFFQLWTCKEAFVKATGDGLLRGLDSFTIAVPSPTDKKNLLMSAQGIDDPNGWTVIALPSGPEECRALAVHARASQLNVMTRQETASGLLQTWASQARQQPE